MTIRDIPSETRDVLAARARRAGQSLQEYMRRTLIESAAERTTNEWLDAVRERVRQSESDVPTEETVRVLRELRGRP